MLSNRKRAYQAELLKYGFTETYDRGQQKSQCVVCRKVLTAESFKKKQLKKHVDKVHFHLSWKPLAYFENLKAGVKKQKLEKIKNVTFDQRTAARATVEVA